MPVDEDGLKIRPGAARELLISALRVLAKDHKANHQKPKPKEMVLELGEEVLPIEAPIAVIKQAPCRHNVDKNDSMGDDSNVPATKNGRRFVTAATGVAQNPYTGLLHYVQYPVYYPSYPYYV